jgi:hypothetical protein
MERAHAESVRSCSGTSSSQLGKTRFAATIRPFGREGTGSSSPRGGDCEFGAISAIAVDLPSGKASSIRSQTGVSYVESDGVKTPLSLSGALPTSQLVPSLTNGLYGLVTTHTVEAHNAGFVGNGVTACVADTGLDTRNPDIATRLAPEDSTYDVFSHTAGPHATDVYDLHVRLERRSERG